MQSRTFAQIGFGIAALTLGILARPVSAQTIVSPNFDAVTEGDTNNAFPFNYNHSARYQQVYAASEFGALTGPTLITQIAFRPDAGSGAAFSTAFSNIQFDLSTTSAAPHTLSATFASNVGADDTVVRSGAVTLASAFIGPAGGPKNFDVLITLTTPFLYNPANGSLLLDIRKFSAESIGTQLDAQDFNSATSREFGTDVNDASANQNIGTDTGLVTQFTFAAAVPEPGAMSLLLGFSVTGIGLYSRRRARR